MPNSVLSQELCASFLQINADFPAQHATFQLVAVDSAVQNGEKKEAKTVKVEEPENQAEAIAADDHEDVTFHYQKNERYK